MKSIEEDLKHPFLQITEPNEQKNWGKNREKSYESRADDVRNRDGGFTYHITVKLRAERSPNIKKMTESFDF